MKKAQCIHCLHFFSKDSNSTLKNHITHPHCEALKRVAKSGQSSMSRDGSIFVYNPDVFREQFAGLVIQRGLPFNHFDDEQTTMVFQNHLQSRYAHMCMCLKNHLDAQERKQDKSTLETPVDFEEEILDAEVQANEAISLSDEEIALDAASSECSMSGPGSEGEEADAETNYGYDVCHDDY
nr:zinc finger, BED-type, phospholipase-like, homeodomain-like protein [Tanacetum cinerariifolium]